MLTVHGDAGKARMEAEKTKRDEWLAKVSKDPTLQSLKHMGPFPYMFFYGQPLDSGKFAFNNYWYEGFLDQLEDSVVGKLSTECDQTYDGLTNDELLALETEDFGAVLAEINANHRKLEGEGLLVDQFSESESDTDDDVEDEESEVDGEDEEGEDEWC